MNFNELVLKCRSYRRFDNNYKISKNDLIELIKYAALSASGKNLQPLKYLIFNKNNINTKIFNCLKWAGYLSEWDGPPPNERPSAYIIILHDQNISKQIYIDHGIAMQTILLAATNMKLGGCIIASINKTKLREILNVDNSLQILTVIAIGRPIENIKVIKMLNNNHKYYRDENNIHYVPKRPLEEILIN